MESGKLFFGIFYSDERLYERALLNLVSEFGEVLKESEAYDFSSYTKFYSEEMGENLLKRIVIFKKDIFEDDLVSVKKFIMSLEEKYSVDSKRRVNVDPGFFSENRIILASIKKKRFKKHLLDGIYSHEILRKENGKWKGFFHTFKDYESDYVAGFFG